MDLLAVIIGIIRCREEVPAAGAAVADQNEETDDNMNVYTELCYIAIQPRQVLFKKAVS